MRQFKYPPLLSLPVLLSGATILILCVYLSACTKPENVTPGSTVIEKPVLTLPAFFNSIISTTPAPLTIDTASTVFAKILSRSIAFSNLTLRQFTDVGDLTDIQLSLLNNKPQYKVSIRPLPGQCLSQDNNVNDDNVNTILTNDKDNNGVDSLGDEWIYLSWQCQAIDGTSVTNGAMTFSGMATLVETSLSTEFANYQLNLNYEITYSNNTAIVFKGVVLSLSRDNGNVTLTISAEQFGILNNNQPVYLFTDFNLQANMRYQINNSGELVDDNNQQTITQLAGKYYSQNNEGYIDFSTQDALTFQYIPAALTFAQLTLQGNNAVSITHDSDNDQWIYASMNGGALEQQMSSGELISEEFQLIQLLTE